MKTHHCCCRSQEISHEGRSLLADRLASNAAASSRCGAPAHTQRTVYTSQRASNGRHPFNAHSAHSHMQTALVPHSHQHRAAWQTLRSVHHSSRSTHGWRSHPTSHLMQQQRAATYVAGAAANLSRASRVQTSHHMRNPKAHSTAWSAWKHSSMPSSYTRTFVRLWHGYAVASYTPKLPSWVRSRLPELPEGKQHSSTACGGHPSYLILHLALASICYLTSKVIYIMGACCAWCLGLREQQASYVCCAPCAPASCKLNMCHAVSDSLREMGA